MKRTSGVHPIVTIVSVLVGAQVAGVWGAIFGLPVAAVISILASWNVINVQAVQEVEGVDLWHWSPPRSERPTRRPRRKRSWPKRPTKPRPSMPLSARREAPHRFLSVRSGLENAALVKRRPQSLQVAARE